MTFLQKIYEINKDRVAAAKKSAPIPDFTRTPHDVKGSFKNKKFNIIAEIKFASPSEGALHAGDPVKIADGYLSAGAAMLSVLTEPVYFKGELEYLRSVRAAHPSALLLRKDFIVDEYQLREAKAYGADAALLIAAMTEGALTKDLFQAAKGLGLTPFVEVHDERELEEAVALGADFIGVNNRNLKTLKIDLNTGRALAKLKPEDSVFICESGLSTQDDVREMRGLGYDGFLMGTHFMRSADPGAALRKFMGDLACA